jgi:hypothetical protein
MSGIWNWDGPLEAETPYILPGLLSRIPSTDMTEIMLELHAGPLSHLSRVDWKEWDEIFTDPRFTKLEKVCVTIEK